MSSVDVLEMFQCCPVGDKQQDTYFFVNRIDKPVPRKNFFKESTPPLLLGHCKQYLCTWLQNDAKIMGLVNMNEESK